MMATGNSSLIPVTIDDSPMRNIISGYSSHDRRQLHTIWSVGVLLGVYREEEQMFVRAVVSLLTSCHCVQLRFLDCLRQVVRCHGTVVTIYYGCYIVRAYRNIEAGIDYIS